MRVTDLYFDYPEDLVALTPVYPPRVMWSNTDGAKEISWAELKAEFKSGDVLVLNDTKVVARRIFAKTVSGVEFEILFVEQVDDITWRVLCPASRLKPEERVLLPGGIEFRIHERGRVQTAKVSTIIDEQYFEKWGEIPLPPYIQKARKERHTRNEDGNWYQTSWAKTPGSSAAPTASLHFKKSDLDELKEKGVQIVTLTLHVGLGTYLPVTVQDLRDHHMHHEWVSISSASWMEIQEARDASKNIWALGTTVARSLESAASGVLPTDGFGGFVGTTNLMIIPGFDFKVVTRLLTNFHQPESTLLALVMGFAGRENVQRAYKWAVQKGFRLFSYGDLTAWVK